MKNLALTLSLFFLFGLSLGAQQKDVKKDDKKELPKKDTKKKKQIPVNINADHMKYDEKGSIIHFTGNVTVDDGSMKMTCDFMTVKLDKDRQAKLIICEKNVVIRKEKATSHSDRAEYFIPDEKVILTGNPRVNQINESGEKQKMTGNKIILYRNTNIIESYGVGMTLPAGSTSKKDDKKKDVKKEATK